MMAMIVSEILIALFDDLIRGLAMFGCGSAGLPYPEDQEFVSTSLKEETTLPTLGPLS